MLQWQDCPFDELDLNTLYDLLALRQAVFAVEQQSIYLDIDGRDRHAHFLVGRGEGVVVATLRVLAPGVAYADAASIGRVCLASAHRGHGAGRALVAQGMQCCRRLHPDVPIRISAQAHLQAFYASFGFAAYGEPYQEDGIPHQGMIAAPAGQTRV